MGDGVPYPFYLIYLLSSVGAKPDSPTSAHRAEKSMYRNARNFQHAFYIFALRRKTPSARGSPIKCAPRIVLIVSL